jgi:P pilus assembly chaperone PapD
MNVLRSILLTTTIMSIGLSFAQAGVVIGGTRVIFDGNKKEASISINNPDNTPILSSHGLKRRVMGSGRHLLLLPRRYID